MARRTTPLHDGWTLTAVAPEEVADADVRAALPVPATVPGTVHTDLLAAGLIPDPYLDENEQLLEWIGHADWRYRTHLGPQAVGSPGEDVTELVFDGLDTLATVRLDGRTIGRTRNMHRRYRFDVTDLLEPAGNELARNELTVEFSSAWVPSQEAYAAGVPDVFSPYTHLRKMACNFGWDWGPALVTAGIWRAARIERWDVARLDEVSPQVSATPDGQGHVRIGLTVVRDPRRAATPLRITAEVAGRRRQVDVAPGADSAEMVLTPDDVRLWWPRGHGEQPLYDLTVALDDEHGTPLDRWERRVGFRSAGVNTEPDDDGVPFVFEINGRQIPVRGANWIPDDCFPSRVGRDRIERRLTQSDRAGVNLLRVWGGGVYESDDFYQACDEHGILVWQDFLFAVAPYPETEPLRSEVEAEARDNVQRLMSHPSLVLWNGNNENFLGWGLEEWHWPERVGGRGWGSAYYLDLLPRVVAEVDPSRDYWPGSPYSGDPAVFYNDPARGLVHLWDAWNERDYDVYRDYPARFVSEFGWQGPPTWSSLARAVHDEPLARDTPGMLNHQKAGDGNGKLDRGLAPHFPPPVTFDDWHFAMQLNQARAVRYGIDHFRSLAPLNMGTIVWQLNDCWPVVSWAMVDGDGRLKPVWYAIREAYAPRTVTIQPRDGGLALIATDDRSTGWRPTVEVRRIDFDGTVRARQRVDLVTDGVGAVSQPLDDAVARPGDPRRELIVADGPDGLRATWFFAEDKDLAYPEPGLDLDVTSVADGAVVTVRSGTFIRDLCLFADRLEPAAESDVMLLTLLPGEEATITVTGISAERLADGLTGPVVRSANDLVR